jgi:hypothetical protein
MLDVPLLVCPKTRDWLRTKISFCFEEQCKLESPQIPMVTAEICSLGYRRLLQPSQAPNTVGELPGVHAGVLPQEQRPMLHTLHYTTMSAAIAWCHLGSGTTARVHSTLGQEAMA